MADTAELLPDSIEFHRPVYGAMPPENLIQHVAEGDRKALEALYHLVAPRLFAIALRMVRLRDVAEDVLQDVFVTLWQKAGQFDPLRGDALAWLTAITRRKAIDILRSSRESVGRDDDAANFESMPDVAVDVETRITMRNCLSDIKPEFTRALELCYTYGLTHEELAIRMQVPVGTAKSWIRRGLEQIKGYMTDR